MKKIVKRIMKYKWLIILLWVVMSLALFKHMPDMAKLTLEKGQPNIPSNYSIKIAQKYSTEFNNYSKDSQTSSFVIVFNNKNKLSGNQLNSIKSGLKKLESDKSKLGIKQVETPFDSKDLEKQMVSEDKTTVMASVSINNKGKSQEEIKTEVSSELKGVSVKYYLTGSDFINDANIKTNAEGVKKTEIFTGIIIFVILLIVFRSLITPVVSIITILLTYMTSLGVVTQLVDKFNFPFATTTQTFLILILFGIGTDYNILLLTRFKEELINNPVNTAIKNTYKSAGKTVLYCTFTILIGFGILVLAKFSIFRAASAVAIAVIILVLELFTLLPCFMLILGKNIFWPNQKSIEHKESLLWKKLTTAATSHPLVAVILTLALTLPFIFTYNGNLSYDMLGEINPSYDAVKATNILSDKFGKGVVSPVTIYIKSNKAMNNNDNLASIDKLTQGIENVSGVSKVYSVTRPKSEKLEQLYIDNQTSSVVSGLDKANGGLVDVSKGLTDANSKISNNMDLSKVDDMVKGSNEVTTGLSSINDALYKIKTGIDSGATGTQKLNDGIIQLKGSLVAINGSTSQITESSVSLSKAYVQLGTNYKNVEQQLGVLLLSQNKISGYSNALATKYPEIKSDPAFNALNGTVAANSKALNDLQNGIATLNNNFSTANDSFAKVNNGLQKITSGMKQIESGFDSLQSGTNAIVNGLNQGSKGQSAVIENTKKLTTAMVQINEGQKNMKDGLEKVGDNTSDLKTGLEKSTSGLNDVSSGIKTANGYLKNMSNTSSSKVFYIPNDTINSGDFNKSTDSYMSSDYKITKIVVNLSVDPYSEQAINTIGSINTCIDNNLKNNTLNNATFGIDGTSSTNKDLKAVSSGDLSRTKVLMLIGIGLFLIFITKSLSTALSIIGSLLLANYTSIAITGYIFKNILHRGDLAWAVPFFVFIMIIALGVDYSIFFIMKFNENKESDLQSALIKSSASIGGIIISAAFILSGTFAALYPANVPTLIEIATGVIIGLLLLTFILIPIFLPGTMCLIKKLKNHLL